MHGKLRDKISNQSCLTKDVESTTLHPEISKLSIQTMKVGWANTI